VRTNKAQLTKTENIVQNIPASSLFLTLANQKISLKIYPPTTHISNARKQFTRISADFVNDFAKDFANNNASTAFISFYFLIHFVSNIAAFGGVATKGGAASAAFISFYFLIHFANNIASTAFISFYFLIHFASNKSTNNARKQRTKTTREDNARRQRAKTTHENDLHIALTILQIISSNNNASNIANNKL
jgi:hypothetical protein